MAKLKFNRHTVLFVVFLLGWTLLAMAASQYIIGLPMIAILGERFQQPLWVCIYDALVYLLALALILFLPPKIYRLYQQKRQKKSKLSTELEISPTELGMKQPPTLVDIGLAPIGYVVYLFLANLLTNLMSVFSWFNADQVQDVGFSYGLMGFNRIIAMIALVLIAPVAEEIIMRGWLYGKLRSKLKVPLAMLLVSALFGLLHGQWNVAISTFALSMVLCSLREITGTIWAGMLLHILSNGIAFYLLYVA